MLFSTPTKARTRYADISKTCLLGEVISRRYRWQMRKGLPDEVEVSWLFRLCLPVMIFKL